MPRPLLGLLLAVLTACAPLHAQDRPPNIVILLADDLGINDLGCYGRKEHPTPNLDKLAADGARFTQAYAAGSVCSPSRAAVLTGQSPARLKITTFLPGRTDRASHRLLNPTSSAFLPSDVPTLAQLLKPRGYVSAAVGKWHLGGKGHQPTDHEFRRILPGPGEPRRRIAARRQRRTRAGGVRRPVHRAPQGQALPPLPVLRQPAHPA